MPPPSPFSLEQANELIRNAITLINRRIIRRTEVIDQIFCALLTREHVLMQSRTGMAKSLLAQQVFTVFEGANLFQVQASKEQQPDTYFGGLDIEELKRGRIAHNTRNSLVESEFGFIDEIFDANDYTLRALLTTLNERSLILGSQVVPARVHTVLAATNYLRVNEVTEAVLDRFIYKSLFTPRKEPYIQYEIAQRHLEYKGRPTMPARRIPYDILRRVSDVVLGQDAEHRMDIPLHVMFFANSVIRLYETQRNRLLRERPQDHPHLKDFYISPRTYTRAMDFLRAVAFLRGRLDVQREDVAQLWYLYTTVGVQEERDLFLKAYETIFKQLGAGRAFEQIQRMLEFQELLETLRQNPALLQRPVTQIEGVAIRRTLREWARETLGLDDAPVEQNRRLLEEYFRSFDPLTEEIADFRRQQEQDIHELFHPPTHIWS